MSSAELQDVVLTTESLIEALAVAEFRRGRKGCGKLWEPLAGDRPAITDAERDHWRLMARYSLAETIRLGQLLKNMPA